MAVKKEGGSVEHGRADVSTWSKERVADFVKSVPGCEQYAMNFEEEHVDGPALLLLKLEHLTSLMKIPVGPAVKLRSKIDTLRSLSPSSS